MSAYQDNILARRSEEPRFRYIIMSYQEYKPHPVTTQGHRMASASAIAPTQPGDTDEDSDSGGPGSFEQAEPEAEPTKGHTLRNIENRTINTKYQNLCCVLSGCIPCFTLAENESIRKSDFSGNHLLSQCCLSFAGTLCCVPCIQSGLQNVKLNKQYDTHLPKNVLQEIVWQKESHPLNIPPGYRPPPSQTRSFIYGCCCYPRALSDNRGVLKARYRQGTVLFEWQESVNYMRMLRDPASMTAESLKVAILGAEKVGKTALFFRLLNDGFPNARKGSKGKEEVVVGDTTVTLGSRM